MEYTNQNNTEREKAAAVARSLISKEQWESDPIYEKIDQWMAEGVPEDVIKKRVTRYINKKEET